MMLPSKIKYLYKLGEKRKFALGLKGTFDGGEYNVSLQEFVRGDPNSINNVVYTRANLGVLFHVKLSQQLHTELFGGISGARRYEFQNNQDQSFQFNAERGNFFSIAIYYVPQK